MRISFWVVQTPTGDRPYVSIHKPQSYIDHLDASGEQATVHSVEVDFYSDLMSGEAVVGYDSGEFLSKVTRVR